MTTAVEEMAAALAAGSGSANRTVKALVARAFDTALPEGLERRTMLRHAGLEVFLVHPGGPFWKNKDEGAWSIPKGEYGGGEVIVWELSSGNARSKAELLSATPNHNAPTLDTRHLFPPVPRYSRNSHGACDYSKS